jgi:hypothetical protein
MESATKLVPPQIPENPEHPDNVVYSPNAEDGLRLITAFMKIKNADDRAHLIAQAEALSKN